MTGYWLNGCCLILSRGVGNFLKSDIVGMVVNLHTFTGIGDGQDKLCSPLPIGEVLTIPMNPLGRTPNSSECI